MTVPPPDVTVRSELEPELPAIRQVVSAAFGRDKNADLIDAIRGTEDWIDGGSLVAIDPAGRVVGHVLLSRGRLVAADGSIVEIGMVGPVAVAPEVQRQGVGGNLMRAAISGAVARRLPVICLLGHPTYYPRFGFEPARPLGIESENPDWPNEAWMVLRLPDWTPELRGVAYFPPAFGDT
jgi:putative acetyltransferase